MNTNQHQPELASSSALFNMDRLKRRQEQEKLQLRRYSLFSNQLSLNTSYQINSNEIKLSEQEKELQQFKEGIQGVYADLEFLRERIDDSIQKYQQYQKKLVGQNNINYLKKILQKEGKVTSSEAITNFHDLLQKLEKGIQVDNREKQYPVFSETSPIKQEDKKKKLSEIKEFEEKESDKKYRSILQKDCQSEVESQSIEYQRQKKLFCEEEKSSSKESQEVNFSQKIEKGKEEFKQKKEGSFKKISFKKMRYDPQFENSRSKSISESNYKKKLPNQCSRYEKRLQNEEGLYLYGQKMYREEKEPFRMIESKEEKFIIMKAKIPVQISYEGIQKIEIKAASIILHLSTFMIQLEVKINWQSERFIQNFFKYKTARKLP